MRQPRGPPPPCVRTVRPRAGTAEAMCRRAWPAGILVLVAAAGAAASGVWRHSRQWTPRAALHLSTRADGGLPPPPRPPPHPSCVRRGGWKAVGRVRAARCCSMMVAPAGITPRRAPPLWRAHCHGGRAPLPPRLVGQPPPRLAGPPSPWRVRCFVPSLLSDTRPAFPPLSLPPSTSAAVGPSSSHRQTGSGWRPWRRPRRRRQRRGVPRVSVAAVACGSAPLPARPGGWARPGLPARPRGRGRGVALGGVGCGRRGQVGPPTSGGHLHQTLARDVVGW